MAIFTHKVVRRRLIGFESAGKRPYENCGRTRARVCVCVSSRASFIESSIHYNWSVYNRDLFVPVSARRVRYFERSDNDCVQKGVDVMRFERN